jgi:hypothetical protein
LHGKSILLILSTVIIKQYEPKKPVRDPRREAGHLAEKQMAYFLHRAFRDDPDLFVLNDIRIVDPGQQGFVEEDACQIDHLVLHRWGMFIIESKSCTGLVRIRGDGTGGDEWEFPSGRGSEGRGSPLSQARRQADYLRNFLHARREELLGTFPTGLRTLAKVVHGTDQRGVMKMPMQAIVAISEQGRLDRKGWMPSTVPFTDYVCKADQVVGKVKHEYDRHRKSSAIFGKQDGEYGLWLMKAEEVEVIARFLNDQHTPVVSQRKKRTEPVKQPATPSHSKVNVKQKTASQATCKECGRSSLNAMHGRYGYYWKCEDCSANTAMPRVCGVCGDDGAKSKKVRVRKEGAKYFRSCESCGIEECIWTEPASV